MFAANAERSLLSSRPPALGPKQDAALESLHMVMFDQTLESACWRKLARFRILATPYESSK